MMEIIKMEQDIPLICIKASSFPEGVLEAHQSLHKLIPYSSERKYFGLSKPNEQGIIQYKAAMEFHGIEENKYALLEQYRLSAGTYAGITVTDFKKNISAIGNAFQQLIVLPELDPETYCIEWYNNEKDVLCMVKLKASFYN